jgi:hypothetical protein
VWPKGEWFSVARDRVGDHAVTRIQRSNAKNFFCHDRGVRADRVRPDT